MVIITGGASGIGWQALGELSQKGTCRGTLMDRAVLAEGGSGRIRNAAQRQRSMVDVRSFVQMQRVSERNGEIVRPSGRSSTTLVIGRSPLEEIGYMTSTMSWMSVAVPMACRLRIRHEETGFGHIVNTTSIAGFEATGEGLPHFNVKYAVVGLSVNLRIEAARHESMSPCFVECHHSDPQGGEIRQG
jgi:NAD(P)-dependent dehydrogenase (short-subunit alcohol dehydrogenase family)